jgi:xylulokinase
MRALGLSPREIRLTGGGSRSPVWRQIAADIFDCPVVCPAQEEGAAYGAALHAMWVAGLARGVRGPISDLTERFIALDESTRAEPRSGASAVYRELQALFDGTAGDLGGVFAHHRRVLTR